VVNKKGVYYAGIVGLALLIAAFLLLILYARQHTLPNGMTVDGLPVGEWTVVQLRQKLEEAEHKLAARRVEWTSPHGETAPAAGTFGQFGLRTNGDAIAVELETLLYQGSLFERAKHRWRLRNHSYPWEASFSEEQLGSTVATLWKGIEEQQPINAQRVITPGDGIEYVPEKKVLRVDRPQLKALLYEHVAENLWDEASREEPLRLQLPLRSEAPPVTVESLKAEGIDRKIAQFTTVFPGSGEGRVHNIRSTAETIHDLILKPDEVFDYGKVIQETTKRVGYRNAPVIFNGKIVPGIGGGICQVSSTLYNAVLRSGLEIVERRNHSLPVKYVPLGQDATFSDGYINFKFRNTTGHHLLIRTSTTSSSVTVKLFGNIPHNVTYDIQSKVVGKISPPIKYIHSGTVAPRSSRVIDSGQEGHIVETYRFTRQDGAIVNKELISKDTYKPTEAIVAIPYGSPLPKRVEPKQTPLLEDGVSGPVHTEDHGSAGR
jgi:vancomycin resistance protein YoaR